ncbi:hypothetical protein BHM03_00038826 [Ensete ventricosum]|nr:hypothetical protein BHM03_00038826 [Ensete ventricosum]
MASPPIGSGRLQPRPPCKGVAGCVQAPCKGRPPAGAATARGYDRLWPDRKGLPLEGTHARGGCPRRARKGRPTPDSIIVAKERHKSWNIHFHVGILVANDGIQRWIARPRTFRKIFSEFNGAQLNLKCHQTWASPCAYIYKEDKSPVVWGIQDKLGQEEVVKALSHHKRVPLTGQVNVVKILTELQEWQQVHDEPSQQRPTLLPAGVATLAARVAAPWQGGCHPQRAVTASAR